MNIIPIIKHSKRPLVAWKEWQEKKFPRKNLNNYKVGINFACICGKSSNGLCIIDFDFEEKPKFGNILNILKIHFPDIKDTLVIKSPKGLHLYLLIKEGDEIPLRQTQLKCILKEVSSIDVLGENGYVLVPPSMTENGSYDIILDNKPAIVSREYFDKIVKFYSVSKEEDIKKPETRKVNLNKFRLPFQHILEGKINIATLAKQTHQDEFVYWKFLYLEGINNGYRPEELYPLLRKAQPSFDEHETETQTRHHIKPNMRPLTAKKIGIYFPSYEKVQQLEDWLIIAKQLKKEFNLITMNDSLQILMRKGNIYTMETDDFYNKIGELLEEETAGKGYPRKRHAILTYIKDTTRFSRDNFFYEKWLINFKNGYYDLKNKAFIPHKYNEDKIFCYEIPHNYIKGQQHYCPYYKKLLQEWLGDKNKVTIEDIFEMMGYSMTMNTSMKKAFFIFGEADAGKTQFQNILEYIIGHKNRASTSLQRLSRDQFGTDDLQFKLINMIGDMSDSSIEDLSIFKVLTGGDKYVEAEYKGGKKYQFRNIVKIWYNANFIPKVINEYDKAFFIRWILISFPNVFPEGTEGRITDIYDIVCEDEKEIQGIIHEAIKGAKRLMKRGYFRREIVEDTAHIWRYNSDIIYAFLTDHCIRGTTESVPAKEFHTELNTYLYKKGRRTLSNNKIKTMLESHGIFKQRSGTENEYGTREEYYNGIGWKPEQETIIKRFDF